MRLAIVILVALLAGTSVQAQGRDGFAGPFTGYEAQQLSEVWSQIRVAAHFEDINWSAHGLNRAPGSPEAQRILSDNWDEYYGSRNAQSSRTERYGRGDGGSGVYDEVGYHNSPYTRDEFEAMSEVWSRIRQAARYDDINWRGLGLAGAPGGHDARRLTGKYWNELRKAARFEDINWQATTGYQAR